MRKYLCLSIAAVIVLASCSFNQLIKLPRRNNKQPSTASEVISTSTSKTASESIFGTITDNTPVPMPTTISTAAIEANQAEATPVQERLLGLDKQDLNSVIGWITNAVNNHDASPLSSLMPDDGFMFIDSPFAVCWDKNGIPIYGNADNIQAHLSTTPVCRGVTINQSEVIVWYTDWNPLWEDCPFMKPSRNGAFILKTDQGDYGFWGFSLLSAESHFGSAYGGKGTPFTLLPCDSDFSDYLGRLNETSSAPLSCPGAPAQRVAKGSKATVCTKSDPLRFRIEPGKDHAAIGVLAPGTKVEVIDGPVCAGNNWTWWKVTTADKRTGWVAEGGDNIDPYFLCPIH